MLVQSPVEKVASGVKSLPNPYVQWSAVAALNREQPKELNFCKNNICDSLLWAGFSSLWEAGGWTFSLTGLAVVQKLVRVRQSLPGFHSVRFCRLVCLCVTLLFNGVK